MEVTAAREAAENIGRSSVTEAERRQYKSADHSDCPPAERGNGRDAPSLKRAPLIPETGGQLSERRPPGTDGEPSERRRPGTDREPSERRPPGTDGEPSERRPPGTDGEPSERRHPGTDGEPSQRRPPGTDGEPSERRPPGTDREPSERRHPGTDREPSKRRRPGTDREPSKRRPPGTDREPSERRPPGTDGEPSERQPPGTDGEPSERRPPGTDGEPSKRPPPGTDGEPSERRPPGTDGEPSERRPPGTDGEPSERRPPGTDGEPLQRRPTGTDGEPSQRHVIVRGRRENALRSYRDGLMSLREESARGGYERAWHALSGYELAMPPLREAAPHPISGYERLSVDRAHTMKDFEKQITELKKDNFNLKLRIYFLEEQVQRPCDTSNDELHRMNIELKVEVESLKHDFQEKHNLLVRASKAMESLSGEHDLAVQRLREEDLKHLEDMADAHNHKVQVLQAEMAIEKAELEKMCMLLDQERMQRFSAEEKLLMVNEQYSKSVAILEERDWIIQCLNDSVHSKDALITQLEQQITSMMPNDAKDTTPNTSHLQPKSNVELLPEAADPVCKSDENVNEWQKKIKEMDNLINELQQKLEVKKAEEKNSLKRDKAIQGLTLAMKKKTKENEKLQNEIGNLHVALSKAQEASQLQSIKENIHPDYKKLIFTLQAEQGMHSWILKYERESGGLQKELESIDMLRRWLEESIQANQELRKVMEAQIMAKYKGDDSMSFLGDQTSYLSICLDHLDQNEYFFAGGPQRASIFKNNMDIGESEKVFREESGTQTQSDIRGSAGGNLKTQLDGNLYPSFSEKSTIKGETTGDDAKPIGIQNTVSVATQTDPKTFCDRCIPLQDAAADLLFTLEEHNVPSQRPPQMPSHNYEMHRNAKKSRLPVLLKSTLNTKLRTDAAKESNHHCFEKELQIENGLLEKVKCAEMGEDSKNRDLVVESHIPDGNKVDQEQRCPTEQTAEEELDYCRTVEGSMQAEREIMATYVRCKDSDLTNAKHTESAEKAFEELKAENSQLLEQLKQAQMEIKAFKAGEEFVKIKASENDLCTSKDKQSSGQALQKKLELENHQLSELLHTSASSEDSMKHKDSAPDLSSSVIEQRACAEQDLQAENQRLSEQLQPVQISTASEDSKKHKDSAPDLSSSVIEQRACAEQDLQAENQRLSEQLKQAQMEIKTLQAQMKIEMLTTNESRRPNTIPSSSYSLRDQMEPTDQYLNDELQAENYRLSDQLKTAQLEIEKLLAEKRSDSSDNSLKLHGSDADDDLSEQSLLDKTITNSVNVIEVETTSDFGDEVCRPSVNSQNAAALRCHHDSHCTECANNRGIISLQTLNSTRASTMHPFSKFTNVSSRRSFEETTSLSKYDLLVQSQARELSLQRQKIKESHNLSVICSKNFYNILKFFENLFPTSTLDSNATLEFQEQITQTVEWLKELEYKLSDAVYGEEDTYSDQSVDSLLYTPSRLVPGHRMWADKHGCHVLGLVEDYNALRKQMLEARDVLQEMENFVDHGVQTAVVNMTGHFENIFFDKLTRTKQSLEEAGCLLKLLWRVSLPLQIHSPSTIHQEEEANLEITRLRKRVVAQEKMLSGIVKRVYSENQMKEDIEKLILNQLAMTHDILKRAKGNLEVQVVDKLQ
ncbi:uncharacterized protein LOC143817506 [Ranitomeya variabilis]|uniref:uncharacterized protein LOC143817506 n=1 Tax=Ranitomeya variabilis TaxID=490064 RepID=UPI00405673EC